MHGLQKPNLVPSGCVICFSMSAHRLYMYAIPTYILLNKETVATFPGNMCLYYTNKGNLK